MKEEDAATVRSGSQKIFEVSVHTKNDRNEDGSYLSSSQYYIAA
jgi:hypothetical protein